jgi:hypothetical protein
MANTYLTRTLGTATNSKKYTISMWLKRSGLGTDQSLISYYPGSGNLYENINFNIYDVLTWFHRTSGNTVYQLVTNRKFRDTSAWYHIVISVDTTQSTASNRVKLYINGVQETSFSTATYPSQNLDLEINKANTINYFKFQNASAYYNGIASHFHFIDGTAYDATAFGEYDANGVWKIKTSPSVTYGTNGFFILKDGNSVTDQSGNTNNFTVGGGTLTNTEDSPSNVFATWNPLDNFYASATFGSGNTGLDSGGSGIETYNTSTLGMSSGKYYMELKHNGGSATPFRQLIGITQNPTDSASQYLGGSNNDSWGYYDNTGNVVHNASTVVSYSTWTQNDIIGVAVDLDNSKLFFAKNGTWQNSSNPANGTNGISIDSGFTYYFAWGDLTTHSNYCNANFGNGYFGTTAVSSAGTNASGIGIFEHDVPTGFTALSTKGLNL